MEQHIYACNVITNFEHEVRGRMRVDDFLIVAMDSWQDVARTLGSVFVDERSMMDLMQWALAVEAPYKLLISIDGKYGAIATTKDIDNPKPGSEVIWIGADVWAPVSKVKAAVQRILANQPEVARKLNFKPADRLIPERFTLKNAPARFNVEELPREIGGVKSVLENATDDALVWLALIGANNGEGFTPEFNSDVTSELSLRIHKKMNFLATFFPLDSVTEKEIEARARRTKKALAIFEVKFPANQPASLEEVTRYARRLSTDRLAELTIVRYYTEAGFDEKLKFLAAELQKRLSHGWD